MLTVRDLTAAYGETQALHGVDFALSPGQIHAVLGRNGAGKSTLARRIMGLLPARAGRIMLHGKDITDWPSPKLARAGLGYVPEGREVFKTLSVRENLTVAGRIGRGDWTVGRVVALFPNLRPRLSAPAGVLSGGEQQMLAIGRALMTSPSIMILDEPSEGLAAPMIETLLEALRQLKARGTALMLIEQNLDLARELSDQITVLSRGTDVWTGTPAMFGRADEVRARYLGG